MQIKANRSTVQQWLVVCGAWTSHILPTTWELVRNADSQVPSWPPESRALEWGPSICGLTRPEDDSDAHSHLRTIAAQPGEPVSDSQCHGGISQCRVKETKRKSTGYRMPFIGSSKQATLIQGGKNQEGCHLWGGKEYLEVKREPSGPGHVLFLDVDAGYTGLCGLWKIHWAVCWGFVTSLYAVFQ